LIKPVDKVGPLPVLSKFSHLSPSDLKETHAVLTTLRIVSLLSVDSSKIDPDVNCYFSVDSSGIENKVFSFQPRQYEIIILKRRFGQAI
jgi:hypothetical protein